MALISFGEWRIKHRKDGNNSKRGWIAGNARYGDQKNKNTSTRPDKSRRNTDDDTRRQINN